MSEKLEYGLMHCNDREIFFAELAFNRAQWGEIVLNSAGEAEVTIWDCNFSVSTEKLVDLISRASSHLKEFEASKIER